MSVNEAYLGFKFLYGILAPDTTLAGYAPGGVSRGFQSPGTTTPYVVMSLQSPGADTTTNVGVVRLLANPLYLIRAVGPAALTIQIANAAAQIDVLMGGKDGLKNKPITGGFIDALYRESPFQQDTLENGEEWTMFGGLYRMQIEVS